MPSVPESWFTHIGCFGVAVLWRCLRLILMLHLKIPGMVTTKKFIMLLPVVTWPLLTRNKLPMTICQAEFADVPFANVGTY